MHKRSCLVVVATGSNLALDALKRHLFVFDLIDCRKLLPLDLLPFSVTVDDLVEGDGLPEGECDDHPGLQVTHGLPKTPVDDR